MSDINVTVTPYPINVSAVYSSNQIIVSEVGVQGPPGQDGGGSQSSGTTNIVGLISTGDADSRYYSINNPSGFITGFNSGLYYLYSNPLNFANSGDVAATGAAIVVLLNNYLLLSQTGQFYPTSNPNNFLRSGDITQSNTSGLATSGDLESTGTAIINQLPNYYFKSNPNNFIKSGEVNIISGSLQENIERSGGYLYGLINASSAGVSSLNSASGALTINGAGNVSVATVGQTITVSGNTGFLNNYYSVSNQNDYIKSGDVSVQLNGFITTGSSDLRYLATGASGDFYLKSNPNRFSTSGNLEATGTNLQNQITSIKNGTGIFLQSTNLNGFITTGSADLRYLQSGASGDFYLKSNPNNFVQSGQFVSGISVTGGISIQGAVNITGVGGLQVIQVGSNLIQFSGGGGGTTNNITNNYAVNSGSGIFIYRSGIQSGISEQFIYFPTILDARPIVISSLHNSFDNNIIGYQMSGANQSGFWAVLSEATSHTGYYLDIFASNSEQTGMATNVIINNITNNIGGGGSTTNGVTGISITGGISISGAVKVIGVGNVVAFQSGNTIIISGITTLAQNYIGSGSPEGVLGAVSGSLYTDWFNQIFYMKITGGMSDIEGWV